MTFLDLLASFLVLELPQTVGWRPFRTIFCLFSTILEKSGPQIPTLFEKVNPIQPLRPNRSVENDPMRILSS